MKSLMRFVSSEDPVFSNPFTVVDPSGSVWSLATNKVWLVAARKRSPCPRFKGDTASLTVLLRMLRLEPSNPITVDTAYALDHLEEGMAKVMGVVVSLRLLGDLLREAPVNPVQVWDTTPVLGPPSLGILCEDWRAYLMGFEDAEADEVSLVRSGRTAFEIAMSLEND